MDDRVTPMGVPAIYVLGLSFDEDDDKFTRGIPFSFANIIYQDISQENAAFKVKIVESHRYTRDQLNNNEKTRKEFLMFCMINAANSSNYYIKIYSITISFERFIHKGFSNFHIGPVKKKAGIIDNVVGFWTKNFLAYDNDTLAEFNNNSDKVFNSSKFFANSEYSSNLRNNSNILNEVHATEEKYFSNGLEFKDYMTFRAAKSFFSKNKYKDVVLINTAKGRIKFYLGANFLFEYIISPKAIEHLFDLSKIKHVKIEEFRKETALLKAEYPDGSIEYKEIIAPVPRINDPVVRTILMVIPKVYDSKTFESIITDIIYNCVDFDGQFTAAFDDNYASCNFKETVKDPLDRLRNYFGFLLSLSGETMKQSNFASEISLVDFVSFTSCHFKKIHTNDQNVESKFNINELEGDEAWNLMLLKAEKSPQMNHLSNFFVNEKPPSPKKKNKDPKRDLRGPNLENILPKANLSPEMFMQQRIRLFKYLHLLFEDLRLISQRAEEREKLCYFLMTYTVFLNVEGCENYQHYYLQEYPSFLSRIENDEPLQLLLKLLKEHTGSITKNLSTASDLKLSESTINLNQNYNKNLISIESSDEEQFFKETLETKCGPPDILKWIKLRLEGNNSQKFPILYKTTRHIGKIIDLFEGNNKKMYFFAAQASSKFSNLTDDDKNGISTPFHRTFFHIFDTSILAKKMWFSNSLNQLKKSNKRPADLIFLYLIKKKISPLFIDCLAPACSIILKEILRSIRVNMPQFIYNPAIPKSAYLLIQREDIYMN